VKAVRRAVKGLLREVGHGRSPVIQA
jgi:hypothetical protein